MGKILVTNIQRFSLHDGPGIRTTVFLKGCLLRCPWCANPENINPYPEMYKKDGKKGTYGKLYSVDDIFFEVMKDEKFYGAEGGVTFSGGEPLLQSEEILQILKKIKDLKITTAVETCLFVPTQNLNRLLPYIDFFYVDMKIIEESRCKSIIKGDINLYISNLDLLAKRNRKIIVRVPVIGNFTDDTENRMLIATMLNKYKHIVSKVELIKEHNLGIPKYISLDLKVPMYKGVSDELMIEYKKNLELETGIPVDICRI
ncbi:hypothetical protein B5F29_01110 [Lachnoclostridium sp. An196]|uniref:radical SAM protein n=1 Tax=Lachnoclostridium sp. An196 TaxID=1965583 RepID=UPI000B38033D|nr:radical SAM protein [Lachnoclostridium sp. An196]OUP22370.1 hypothetical protein B5F29_01110 [Lachnoclostridium sp. An196]